MKHIATAFAVILSSSGICAAQAADGTITFTGDVTATTCKVEAGASPNTGSADYTLALGTVSASAMNDAATGRRSATLPFNVYVGGPGGQCPATVARTASVRLDATPDYVGAGYLKNTAATPAANVAVVVVDDSNRAVDMSQGFTTTPQSVSDNAAATYRFFGALQGYGAANSSGAGGVAGQLTYTVIYQ